MKYSVFTVSTPEYTPEETLKKLKEYNYDGVEWRVASIPQNNNVEPSYWEYNKSTIDVETIEEKAEELKNLCNKYEINICALATYLGVDQRYKVEKVLKAAVKMGCPKIRVNVPSYDGKINYNELLSTTIEKIKELEVLAKKYKVKINFEIHMGNIIPSASAAYRLVSNFDSKYIGVIHDAGNMVYEGFEQYKMGIEILGQYLDHVHIKNARWVIKETNEAGVNIWQPEWYPIKKGQANLKTLIEALRTIGYDGYLSFEDFSNEKTIDEKLKDNIEYLKSL